MFYFIISIIIDLLPSVILLTPVILLWQIKFRKNTSPVRNVLLLVFTVYLMAIFQVTGIPAIDSFSPEFTINLVPTITLRHYPVHYILNIFMFIPFGLLTTSLWKCFSKFRTALATGFSFSMLIELLQLLTFRVTDIDDLITNTLGAVIGFLLARLLHRIHGNTIQESKNTCGMELKELCLLLGMSLCMWMLITPLLNQCIQFYSR